MLSIDAIPPEKLEAARLRRSDDDFDGLLDIIKQHGERLQQQQREAEQDAAAAEVARTLDLVLRHELKQLAATEGGKRNPQQLKRHAVAFYQYCREREMSAFPADDAVVAMFALERYLESSLRRVQREVQALDTLHRMSGRARPGDSLYVRAAFKFLAKLEVEKQREANANG
jgi:hypothetical protein